VIVDGAYGSKAIFRVFAVRVIDSLLRVRMKALFKGGGCMSRKFAVVGQLGNSGWDVGEVMVMGGWWSGVFKP
jgi:hypothetical protein